MAYRQNDSQIRNDTVRFNLLEHIGVLSRKENGWTREVNIVAWNGGAGKVDIREWNPEHSRMSKGVTLFEDEAEALTKVLARRYGLRLTDREAGNKAFAKENGDRPLSREDTSMSERAYEDTGADGRARTAEREGFTDAAPAAAAAAPYIAPAAAAPAMA